MKKYEVLLPTLGATIKSATLTHWHKNVGDSIELDESLFDIQTEKVESEIPCPYEGVVTKLCFEEGDEIAVGAVVAIIENEE